jgi:colicin import membrane protein
VPGILKGAKQGFTRTIAGSFILHILVIAAALFLFNSEPRTFFSPVYTVNLVAPGPVKRDETVKKRVAVEAPVEKPVEQPVTKPVEKPVKKAEPAPLPEKKARVRLPDPAKPTEKAIAIKPKETNLDDAIKKIAAEVKKKDDRSLLDSRIEELKKKRAAESKDVASRLEDLKKEISGAGAQAKPAPRAAEAPQTGASGGIKREDLEARYPAYFSLIHDRVQDEWSIHSEDLKDSKLSIIVSVRIARSGKLLETHIEKSSGDSHFDGSLIKAIRKAEFPPLPQDFEGDSLETGFRFCPGCK